MPLTVSVVIYEDAARRRVLAVLRPESESESFGGMWGLPAATVGANETAEEAVRRLGSQKLGMTLEISGEIGRGEQDREDGTLSMVLYEVWAREREPRLVEDGDAEGVTYYVEWKWAEARVFEPTAEEGSLCCQLFLESIGLT
jgi:ADP-ribose pyrophosphatase YjhB (NUDIX family)